MSNRNDQYKNFVGKNIRNMDEIIPWPTFRTNKNMYATTLQQVIRNAGVSPTEYIKFGIDNLINYLSGLRVAGQQSVDVHIAVTNSAHGQQLDVIFTAHTATDQNTLNTSAYDLGEVYP